MIKIIQSCFHRDFNAKFHLGEDGIIYCEMTDGFFYDEAKLMEKIKLHPIQYRNKIKELFEEANEKLTNK